MRPTGVASNHPQGADITLVIRRSCRHYIQIHGRNRVREEAKTDNNNNNASRKQSGKRTNCKLLTKILQIYARVRCAYIGADEVGRDLREGPKEGGQQHGAHADHVHIKGALALL